MAPRASRRKGVCSDEDPHGRKWIGHVDEGVVNREAELVPKKGRIDETHPCWSEGGVCWETCPSGWEEEYEPNRVKWLKQKQKIETETETETKIEIKNRFRDRFERL